MVSDQKKEQVAAQLRARNWLLLDEPPLGIGGSGTVYLCCRMDRGLISELVRTIGRLADPSISSTPKENEAAASVARILQLARIEPLFSLGALKIAHDGNRRMGREIEAMLACQHDHLAPVLFREEGKEPSWFVTRFFAKGSLEKIQPRLQGKIRPVLERLRPLADALAAVHGSRLVHRDVKANNVFVDENDRWILGDFGSVFDPNAEGLTDGTAPVSRDWIPDWVAGKKVAEWDERVDVFMLAKLAHFMLTGSKVRASQIDEPDADVRKLFPAETGIEDVGRFFLEHIVTKERELKSSTVAELGFKVDELLAVVGRSPAPAKIFEWLFPRGHWDQGTLATLSEVPVSVGAGLSSMTVQARIEAPFRTVARLDIRLTRKGTTFAVCHLSAPSSEGQPQGRWSEPTTVRFSRPVPEDIYSLEVFAPPKGALQSNVVLTGLVVFVS